MVLASGVTDMQIQKQVSEEYLEGIRDGRKALRRMQSESPETLVEDMQSELDCCTRTARQFDAQSPVGQLLRGERDFWRNQVKRAVAQ